MKSIENLSCCQEKAAKKEAASNTAEETVEPEACSGLSNVKHVSQNQQALIIREILCNASPPQLWCLLREKTTKASVSSLEDYFNVNPASDFGAFSGQPACQCTVRGRARPAMYVECVCILN